MNRNKLIYIGIILFCISLVDNVFSQKMDSLTLYKLNSKRLKTVVDSFMESEKGCEYYGDDLNYFISFNNHSRIQIGSFKKMNKSNVLKGYFIRNNKVWILRGLEVYDGFFNKTNKKRGLDTFGVFRKVESISIDDRYSFRVYKNKSGKLHYIDHHTFCD